ncbi:MAG TPA: carboxypeptidase-like regulatory domain-containing protein, partial [Pyrinomonadaceae bacterium]|nr:carboxypeptidase-like regulatory domain-containing protein [Pyrinomonadaceae bacterium]
MAQATQTPTSGDRPETPKRGSITGRVVNESGQPLANAAVYVRAFGSAGQGNATATDGEGNFQVGGLDPLAYQISAVVPAYIAPPRDPDSTQAPYYRVGDSVRLELIRGGVITGLVTTSAGEPVVAVRVFAYMLRDGNGQPPRYGGPFREQPTDDRGIYRIYGLAAGTYIVSAGGHRSFANFNVAEYESHAPTYAPSSTRDNAGEISVRAGEETTNVDIRYRGDPGHVISGFANDPNAIATPNGFNIRLTSMVNGVSQWNKSSFQPPGSRGFAISGIADGDYDVTAETFFPGGDVALSEPRRIKVRGADITGIELTTKPLGSITGRVALEESKAPECKGKRRPLFGETLVTPWHNEKNAAKDKPQFVWSLGTPTFPDTQGDFILRNLAPGQYRFNTRSFAKYWYLQSISLPSSIAPGVKTTPANRPTDAARHWTTIKSRERVSGLTITLAEGAASLHGQIKTAENQKLPARLFVYLVPAEREKAEDVLRFFVTQVSTDGSFALNNLPPGRYWAITKLAGENETNVLSKLRLPDEAEARAKLRQEVEAAKPEIELKPCQNVTNYSLPFMV